MKCFILLGVMSVAALACDPGRGMVMMTSRGELKFVSTDGGSESEVAHAFGDVKTGESASFSIEVINAGLDPLDIKVAKVTTDDVGAFFVQGGMGSVAPDAKRTFKVTFAPVRAGAHTGNLLFETNAASQTARISLTGTAVP